MKSIWKMAIAALAIIVAVVCVFILFDPFHLLYKSFDQDGSQMPMTRSNSYWRGGHATPFAILDHGVSSSGQGVFVLQNIGSSRLTLTKLRVGDGINATGVSFEAGETKAISVPEVSKDTYIAGIAIERRTAGKLYNLSVAIEYAGPGGASVEQPVSMGLVGKYY